MKKNILFFTILLCLCGVYSCNRSDEDVQYIDQLLNIYIKDASGEDLLKGDEVGTYIGFAANDNFGITDNAPVAFAKKTDAGGINYLEYLAGAKREILDSFSPDQKTYHSSIRLNFTQKVNDNTNVSLSDTLRVIYNWTPHVFEVSKVYYNGVLKFTKQPNQPNIITVVK